MENVEESLPKLCALREMAFGIAIDDFGTGYSSLKYRVNLPTTALKIDKSFTADMTTSPDSLSLVSMIISLAHLYNHKAIAEGVETA